MKISDRKKAHNYFLKFVVRIFGRAKVFFVEILTLYIVVNTVVKKTADISLIITPYNLKYRPHLKTEGRGRRLSWGGGITSIRFPLLYLTRFLCVVLPYVISSNISCSFFNFK